MSDDVERLKATLLALPEQDRIELADFLYDSVPAGPGEAADPAFDAELGRRAEAIRNGTAKGRPVDDVMRELRERFP